LDPLILFEDLRPEDDEPAPFIVELTGGLLCLCDPNVVGTAVPPDVPY